MGTPEGFAECVTAYPNVVHMATPICRCFRSADLIGELIERSDIHDAVLVVRADAMLVCND
jgi:hypothetical protein